jgi:hypothetical protein
MATRIQLRRDTSANWTLSDSTLAQGEIGFEVDTNKFKIGSGSVSWTSLDYFGGEVDLSEYLTQSSASSTYITQASASTTYATKTELNNIDFSSASTAVVAAIVDSAPSTLNTLNELAAALGDNPNFATNVSTSLGNKASITNPYFNADDEELTDGTFTIRVIPTSFSNGTSNSFSISSVGIQFPYRSDIGMPFYEPTSSTVTFTYPESLAGAQFSLTRTNMEGFPQLFEADFVLLSSSYQAALASILANPEDYTSGEDFAWTGPGYGDMAVSKYVQPIDIARIAGLTSNVQAQIDAIKLHVGM